MTIEDRLYKIYLQAEYPFKTEDQEKIIVSGYFKKKYWVRFTYFKQMKVLIAFNTVTEERLSYQY